MKKLLPVIYLAAFVFGIIMILTADTGLIAGAEYHAAIIAGTIISCFAGIYLAIFLFHNHT
ncbi:MAG: hypothetical protein ACI4ET_10165 [Bilifractor sp.]